MYFPDLHLVNEANLELSYLEAQLLLFLALLALHSLDIQ